MEGDVVGGVSFTVVVTVSLGDVFEFTFILVPAEMKMILTVVVIEEDGDETVEIAVDEEGDDKIIVAGTIMTTRKQEAKKIRHPIFS